MKREQVVISRVQAILRAIEEPSTVGLLPALDDMQGIADAPRFGNIA